MLSQRRPRSRVISAEVQRSRPQRGAATVLSTVHLPKREKKKSHWSSWILHEGPAMTGWRGKTKGQDFIWAREGEREGEEGEEGWRRDKEGPVRPNKDGLYSNEGQMGVLFMVFSPYTPSGAPSGPFKAEEVYLCVCVQTLSLPWLRLTLGTIFIPQISTLSCPPWQSPRKVSDVWARVRWWDLSVFCHFYSLKLLIIPEVC